MSGALAGVIGLAAGWAWACLAADLFFLLRVCGVAACVAVLAGSALCVSV